MAPSVPRKQERRPAGTAADWEREELTRHSGKLCLSRPDDGGRGRRAARRPRRRSATVGWRPQPHPDDEAAPGDAGAPGRPAPARSAEHTSELQSIMRISSAVFYLKNIIMNY